MDRHYPCIGVVADDLPGAIIAGAALRKSGLRVVVVSEQERDWPSQADAVVVSAGSREVAAGVRSSPLRSEELISSYVRRLRSELRCRRVALRIDAALRRDFTADVTAALQAARLSDPVTLAVMAMPRAGRITVNGRQTAFIADGEERERLVSRHVFGDLGAHVVCEATISRGAGAITDEIEAGLARTRRFVLDSSREPHLLAIANAAATLELRYDLLTVSSGSWLSYFPGEATGSAFVLVAIGLPTPPSDKQIKALVDESNCRLLTVDQAMHLAMGSSVELLTEVANADVIAIFVPGDEGSTSYTDPARIAAADRVAAAVECVLLTTQRHGRRCEGLVGVGAFTAARVMRALGASVIVPTDDSEPHAPTGVIASGDWIGLTVAVKGGLIGGPNALVDLVRALRSRT